MIERAVREGEGEGVTNDSPFGLILISFLEGLRRHLIIE
jgi:hypothetical protein